MFSTFDLLVSPSHLLKSSFSIIKPYLTRFSLALPSPSSYYEVCLAVVEQDTTYYLHQVMFNIIFSLLLKYPLISIPPLARTFA